MSRGFGAEPTAEEAVAIAVAAEALWPRPVAPAPPAPPNGWRFSGRSWARPLMARRDRPWLSHPTR